MHPYQQIVFRHWPGVQEALTGIRSGDLAGDELFERFNAFSDNDHAQLTPKLSHCLDDRQGSPISRQEFDEGTINLEFGRRNVFQAGQTGKAGSEIINRQPDAQRACAM